MVLVMGPDGLVPAPPMGAPPINASSPLALARRGGGAGMVLRGSPRPAPPPGKPGGGGGGSPRSPRTASNNGSPRVARYAHGGRGAYGGVVARASETVHHELSGRDYLSHRRASHAARHGAWRDAGWRMRGGANPARPGQGYNVSKTCPWGEASNTAQHTRHRRIILVWELPSTDATP